jgi:hypothetical protein
VRNFQCVSNVNAMPLAHALQRKPYLWGEDDVRTTFPGSPHVEVDDILLRFEDMDAELVAEATRGNAAARAALEAAPRSWRPAWHELPEAKPLVLDLMRATGAYELARVMITRLRPGGRIYPHADTEGEYANLPDIARYHLVLQGLAGSLFHCGNETVHMATGDIWWFDARQQHAVENNSVDDRIHLLIDVRVAP